MLRACDELGMLVWEEIPVVDLIALGDEFRANATSALREMIRRITTIRPSLCGGI